jgi:hypothetical protein
MRAASRARGVGLGTEKRNYRGSPLGDRRVVTATPQVGYDAPPRHAMRWPACWSWHSPRVAHARPTWVDRRLQERIEKNAAGMPSAQRRAYLKGRSEDLRRSARDLNHYFFFYSAAAWLLGLLVAVLYALARFVAKLHLGEQEAIAGLDRTTDAVRHSTDQVHAEVRALAAETARAQRLAIRVGRHRHRERVRRRVRGGVRHAAHRLTQTSLVAEGIDRHARGDR